MFMYMICAYVILKYPVFQHFSVFQRARSSHTQNMCEVSECVSVCVCVSVHENIYDT